MKKRLQKGAAVVEFAILSALLLVFLFGIVEFGFLWLESHYIANAAREGARIAAKTPGTLNDRKDAADVAAKDYLLNLFLFEKKLDFSDDSQVRVDYEDPEPELPDPSNPGEFIDGMYLAQVTVTVDTSRVWDPVLWSLLNSLPFVGENGDFPNDYLTSISQNASFVIEN